jgi:hypothetical protein
MSTGDLPIDLYVEIAKYDIVILHRFRQCCHGLLKLSDLSLKMTNYQGDSDDKLFREFANIYYRGFYIKCGVYEILVVHQSPINMLRLVMCGYTTHPPSGNVEFKRSYVLTQHTYMNGDDVYGGRGGGGKWDRLTYLEPIPEYVYRFFVGGYNIMYIHTRSTTDFAPTTLYIVGG